MGFANIEWGELRSISTRSLIAQNSEKFETRIIKNSDDTDEEGNSILGFLGGVFGGGVKFLGWLFQSVTGAINWTLGGLWSLAIRGALYIYNFNWNLTDEELDARMAALVNQLGSQLGGTIGNSLGYLVCGVVPAALLLTVNKPMATYILSKLGAEAAEEFLGNLAVIIRTTANIALQSAFGAIFKGTRRIVRELTKDPDSFWSRWLNNFYGVDNMAALAQNWAKGNTRPWSFRIAIEEAIDAIPNAFIQNFFEELHEEFLEGCVEAGYVAGSALDEWIFQQKLQQQTELGQTRVVEITPDRSVETETLIVAGNEQLVRTQIPQILATYRMIEDRDMGMIVGEPVRENIRDLVSPLTLRINLNAKKKPPFNDDFGNKTRRVQITLPFVKRSKLDWQDIKTACGGVNGYLWGRFKALVKLENGHSFEFWAASRGECEDQMERLLVLCEVDMVGVTITEETKKGKRLQYSALYKEETRIYPTHFTLFNSQKVLNEDSGRATLTGVYKRKRDRFELWTDTQPDDYQESLAELLRVVGTNGNQI